MKNKSSKTKKKPHPNQDEKSTKEYKKWKEEDKNRMGNDISSEIKIANAEGELEGGDNKQWHMDQGDFNDDEKNDFENKGDSK